MKAILYSNKGPVREHNEDALFIAGNIISRCSMITPLELEIEASDKCFIVIDGMGGYEGGERAAQLVAASFINNNAELCSFQAEEGRKIIRDILESAVNNIADIVAEIPVLSSMGAALAGIMLCDDAILIFNCGDCRVYRQRGEYLERLSHDHSVVQELYDRGEIDEDGMRTHPRKNTITACVSANIADLNIYFREITYAQNGQKFFICSDGVWEALSIDELEACMKDKSISDAANNLAEKLLELHSECHDNISFLIIEI